MYTRITNSGTMEFTYVDLRFTPSDYVGLLSNVYAVDLILRKPRLHTLWARSPKIIFCSLALELNGSELLT